MFRLGKASCKNDILLFEALTIQNLTDEEKKMMASVDSLNTGYYALQI